MTSRAYGWLLEQYGFVPTEGTAADAQLLATCVARAKEDAGGEDAPLGVSDLQKLLDAAAAQGGADGGLASSGRMAALYDVITADDAPPPAALLRAVRSEREGLASSLEKDLEEYESGGGGDPRVRVVLEYRIARKRLLALTEAVLSDVVEGS